MMPPFTTKLTVRLNISVGLVKIGFPVTESWSPAGASSHRKIGVRKYQVRLAPTPKAMKT